MRNGSFVITLFTYRVIVPGRSHGSRYQVGRKRKRITMLSIVNKSVNNKVNMKPALWSFFSRLQDWPSVTYFPASLDLFNLDAKAISRAVIACQPHRGRF